MLCVLGLRTHILPLLGRQLSVVRGARLFPATIPWLRTPASRVTTRLRSCGCSDDHRGLLHAFAGQSQTPVRVLTAVPDLGDRRAGSLSARLPDGNSGALRDHGARGTLIAECLSIPGWFRASGVQSACNDPFCIRGVNNRTPRALFCATTTDRHRVVGGNGCAGMESGGAGGPGAVGP